MKLGTIKTIVKEELSKFEKLPGWMEPFLQTLNQFMNNVGTAVNGNLDFKNNFRSTVKSLEFTSGVELKVNPEKPKLRVTGVACFNTGGLIMTKFGWRHLNDGSIGVTIHFDSGTTSTCEITIFFAG